MTLRKSKPERFADRRARLVRWSVPVAALALAASLNACGNDSDEAGADRATSSLYQETFRPQYHYSPPYGWMNDPNGMVFVGDTYHLFYQFNPYAIEFGSIGWGQASSPDLFNWQPAPVAIPPADDRLIFSGSVVIDERNTSGLCDLQSAASPEDCLIAIYTANRTVPGEPVNQTQDLAISTDRGRTWRQFDGNPVLDLRSPDFRDPKVIWHEPGNQWIMAVVLAVERKVVFFGSPNLRDWTRLSEFGPTGAVGGVWECPDLFELPVDGEPGNSKWVLKVDLNPGHIAGGSGGQYFIGRFDGTRFVQEEPIGDEIYWVDRGRDFYCATHWFGLPDQLAEKIWIGWMNNWEYASSLPTYPWRGAMTMPRTVGLRTIDGQTRLTQEPVASIGTLFTRDRQLTGNTLAELNSALAQARGDDDAMRIRVTVPADRVGDWGLELWAGDDVAGVAAEVGVDAAAQTFYVERFAAGTVPFSDRFAGRHSAPLAVTGGEVVLDIYIDRSSVEVFGNGGQTVITDLIYPEGGLGAMQLRATPFDPRMQIEHWTIGSVWR